MASTGLTGAASAMETAFTADTIWNGITPFIPVIATITIVALGIYFFKRLTKKVARGKGGA